MSRVVVLGGGIVGLWTADVLLSLGHDVTIRTAQAPEFTYSAAAACVITPLLPWEPGDPRFQTAWGRYRRTIAKFRAIDETRSVNERFIEAMPSYECGFEEDGELFLEKGFNISKFNHLPFAKVQIIQLDPPIDVQNHVDDVHKCTVVARFVADFCNTETFLSWMRVQLTKRGATFDVRPIGSLADIRALGVDVVFNCLGFDSARMFPDESMFHVRGQSMFVDSIDHREPYFGIASGHHAIFKHRRGFYFGSYFLERESTVRTYPTKAEYDMSIAFANGPYRALCERLGFDLPRIDLSRIRRVNTGIRPFRPDGPRVEVDEDLAGRGQEAMRVVHNYGHGAHGWTVGYATAEDAVFAAEVRGWLG